MKKPYLVRAMILAGSILLQAGALCLQSHGAANDNFASAQIISGAIGTTLGDNSGTTKEAGEPDHAGNSGGSSIWFRWTAPTNGQYVFNTEGSEIDTVLAVYTGASVNALTLIAENDDDGFGVTSAVNIAAAGGTTYYVAVDGFDGEAGDIVLEWLPQMPPVNDDFVDAMEITGSGGHTNGNTVLASREPGEPDHAGDPGGSSVWFRWIAPTSGMYSFNTDGSAFNTLLAVYTGVSVNSLSLVASNDDSSAGTTSAVGFPATGGTTYYVAVDGFDGAAGALFLNWGTYNDDFPETVALPFTTLHHFTGEASPDAGLILSGNTLYGTMRYGGVSDSGAVFKVNTDGTGFVILHSFNYTDGADPIAGLILSGGSLYGTARAGGSSGYGTVFTLSTSGGGFTNLHQFSETSGASLTNSDGAGLFAGLILSGNTLYGAAAGGGNSGNGTVFALNTNGTGFTVLHSFTATTGIDLTNNDGAFPVGSLICSDGTLYGTANSGGNVGVGTVFRLNTNGTGFTTLHTFAWYDDGAWPRAAILSGDTLYRTGTGGGSAGNGVLFALNTNGTSFRTVHRFAEVLGSTYTNSGGANPFAPLILSGNTLYGTAIGGGNSGSGAAFAVNIDGTEFTILHHFTVTAGLASTNSDGARPSGGLVLSGSALYGTAESGGGSGWGTVFKLSLPQPPLEIISAGANARLTWPTLSGGFTLQTATNLNLPAWSNVAPAPALVDGRNTVTNPVSGAQRFYRLMR